MSGTYGDQYRTWDWPFLNRWTDSIISDYRQFASKSANALNDGETRFTCEDFALYVIVRFAWKYNLPFSIVNGAHGSYYPKGRINGKTFPGAKEHSDYLSYVRKARTTTGASDLRNDLNTDEIADSVDMTDFVQMLSKALPGDLLYFKHFRSDWSHIQLITKVETAENGATKVQIFQGNMHDPSGRNSDDPADDSYWTGTYVGVPIQEGGYDENGVYSRVDKGSSDSDIFMTGASRDYEFISLRRWRFTDWNERVDEATRQQNLFGNKHAQAGSPQSHIHGVASFEQHPRVSSTTDFRHT